MIQISVCRWISLKHIECVNIENGRLILEGVDGESLFWVNDDYLSDVCSAFGLPYEKVLGEITRQQQKEIKDVGEPSREKQEET